MNCNKCGDPAVVKRDEGYYCGKCALTRDWRAIIDTIQDAHVETPVAGVDQSADSLARTA